MGQKGTCIGKKRIEISRAESNMYREKKDTDIQMGQKGDRKEDVHGKIETETNGAKRSTYRREEGERERGHKEGFIGE